MARSLTTTVLLLWMSVSAAQAEPSRTVAVDVRPILHDGYLDGCYVGFIVDQSSDLQTGEIISLQGSLVVSSATSELSIGLRFSTDSAPEKFRQAMQAVLYRDFKTNIRELRTSEPGPDPTFRVFRFKLGDVTSEMVAASLFDERIEIAYGADLSGGLTRFEVDLRGEPAAAGEWKKCNLALVDAHTATEELRN